ncbi:uncharacterized protein LOC135480675 [Liolophura sinensis]|uniref:uncharacterized protein LOC135480675 n=1 Tax=Liolophura sinensis TaxID=3198878 RepID=UPI0031595341
MMIKVELLLGFLLWTSSYLTVETADEENTILNNVTTPYSVTSPDGVIIPESVANKRVSDIKSQDEVDLVKFSGVWYEIARSPYALEYASVKSVIRYMKLGQNIHSMIGHYAGSINGTCLPAFKGHIQKVCPHGPGNFFARGITMESAWGFTKFIYTDYKTALLYFCPAVNEDGTCRAGRAMASVLGREKTVSPEVERFLKETLENSTGIPAEDLVAAEYEDDCFPEIMTAMKSDLKNDSCVFDDFPAQSDFDIEKFSGKWYPIAAQRFVPRPELVNSPLCYYSNGDGSLSVHYVTLSDGQCEATDPFMIVQKCPAERPGEFVVNRGLQFPIKQLAFSKFKILYTDYDVALGVGCVAADRSGRCLPEYSGAAILSRKTKLSPERRDFLKNIAKESCVDLDTFEEIKLDDESVACGCPDENKVKSTDLSDEVGTKNSFSMYDGKFLKEKFLGTWYDVASTPELAASFMVGFNSFISYNYLGVHGSLQSTRVMAKNGTCLPPWLAVSESVCEKEKHGVMEFSIPLKTSWYMSRIIHIDDVVAIGVGCMYLKSCTTVDETNLRVAARKPGWDDVIQTRVRSILEGLGLNATNLVPTEFEVDCSRHILDKPNSMDSHSCETKNFPVHENFTLQNIAGSWHVLSHFSHLNNSVARLGSGVVHYRENNGSIDAFVTGTSETGRCLPLLRFQVHPRCPQEDGGQMWTEEIQSVFQEGAPLTLSATWKVIYVDEESAVVYNCQQETLDGDCDIDNTRISVMTKDFDISAEKRDFLLQQVSKTCVDVVNLWNMTTTTPDECLSVLDEALENLE